MKIGILEGHTIQAITAARSLKKNGFEVVLFCESKNSYGYYTKYADSKILVPSIENNEDEFHEFFSNYLQANDLDAVIPMFDFSAQYLSKHKNELKERLKFIIPDFEIFITGFDKNKFMNFCQENNIPHPITFSYKDIDKYKSTANYPLIIKPNITYGARGFAIVNSCDELENKIQNIIDEYGDVHIQEYIPSGGKQFLVGIYMKNGELVNSTIIEKLRYYPVKGGSSCFNKSVFNDKLVDICFKAQKALNWEGYAHYDLIEDPRNGEVKIMELNPRVQGCIKSSITAGIDFIDIIINDTLNLPIKKFDYKPGAYLRYFGLDLLWFLSSNERFKTKPNWFKGFFSLKHYFQDGGIDDIKPFFFGTISGLLKQMNPKFRERKKGMN